MIGVTERAKQELKRVLSDNVDHPLAVLRLTATEEGKLGLGIDIESPDDEVVEYEGSKVLLVEKGLASSLQGLTLDVQDTADGPQLAISNEPSG